MRSILLVSIFLFSLSLVSAQQVSHSTIYSEDGYLFTVYLNGEKMNDDPAERVRSINLSQPYYSIKIDFVDESLPDIDRKIFQLTDANGARVDATHVIKHTKKDKIVLRWKSQTVRPDYIDETPEPTIVVVGGGQQEVVQQTTTTRTVESSSDGVSMSFGGIGGRVNINTGYSEPVVEEVTTVTTVVSAPISTTTTSSDLPCGGKNLGAQDFEMALKSIASRSDDEGKMTSGKQIVSTNCFTTEQARRVVDLFQTEESKLEMAIFAYPFVIDKGTYFKMNGAFARESSIDELNKAILIE